MDPRALLVAAVGFFPLGFLLGVIGSVPVAGPLSALVVHRTMEGRHRDGIMLAAGAALVESLYCALALSGHDAAVSRWPRIEMSLRVTGAVVMILVGVYFAFLVKVKPRALPARTAPGRGGAKRHFTLGFSLVAINPAVLVNWAAVITVLHTVGLGLVGLARGFAFVLGVGTGVLGWFGGVVLVLRRVGSRLPVTVFRTALRAVGLVLAVAGMISLKTSIG